LAAQTHHTSTVQRAAFIYKQLFHRRAQMILKQTSRLSFWLALRYMSRASLGYISSERV